MKRIYTTPLPAATVAYVPTGVHAEDIDDVKFKISPGEITTVMK